MKPTLHALVAAAALAACGLAGAQGTAPDRSGMTTGSPTTPPTHPTERTTPSDRLPTAPDDRLPAARDQNGAPKGASQDASNAEALQACKNLSSAQDRRSCMDKVARDAGSKGSMDSSGGGASGNPSGTSAGTYEHGSGSTR